MKKILSLLFISLILVMVVKSGAYNIAATEKHWDITEKIIAWVRDSSIEARSKDIKVPQLDDENLFLQGAEQYHEMCTICHLAPGLKSTQLSKGLYPQAPIFYQRDAINDQIKKLDRAKAYFWVIKNGLKMTAMPAWGLSHDDNDIWGMVAFILKMSNMTPEQYQSLISSAKAHARHEGNDHGHSH